MKISFNKKRFAVMMCGIVGMGVFLSFLLEVNYGTDTCAFMNSSLSGHFGISFGTMMICSNLIFFIPEIIWGRKYIGLGTIANMTLIGYISDFCRMLERKFLPDVLFEGTYYRPVVFIVALIPFLISIALYMNADMGLAPYDSVPKIISERFHFPFSPVRIVWDFCAIMLGIAVGGHLNIGTVVLAFTIGPSATFIGKRMERILSLAEPSGS